MVIEDATVIAGISALSGILVKGADILWNYIKKNTSEPKIDKDKEELMTLVRSLYLIISRVDEQNVPSVYTSRRVLTQIDTNVDITRDILNHSNVTNKSLEKISELTEHIVRILDIIYDRMPTNRKNND